MIRLVLWVVVLSTGATWLSHQLRQAITTRLIAAQVVVVGRRFGFEGTTPVVHDVQIFQRGHHLTARRVRIPRWGEAVLEGVVAHEAALGLVGHAYLDQVEVRRAACGLEVRAIGGQVEVERAPAPGGAAPEPVLAGAESSLGHALCRLEAHAVRIHPAGPEGWPTGVVDGQWTPGLISLVLHPDAGGQLALDLPLDRGWVHARAEQLPLSLLPGPLTGTLTGEVSVIQGPTLTAGGHLRWQGGFHHPAVAPEPLADLDVRADFTGHYTPDVALELPHLRVRTGALDTHLQVLVEGGSPVPDRGKTPRKDSTFLPKLQLRATMAPVDCQAAWQSLPRALTGPLAGARLSGRITPRLSLFLPTADPFKLRLDLSLGDGGCHVDALNIPPEAWPPAQSAGPRDDVAWLLEPFTRRVPEATRPVEVGPGTPGYLSIDHMPRFVVDAAIVSEDPAFGPGHALDLGLIRRALMFNLDRGRFVYGGSTIPQQLVKNLYLTRDKTLARKVQEALIALRVAQRVPARRILELYLNCIEFAPNVYGIQAAARHYFGKPVGHLTPKEATFLAITKPNPRYADSMRRRGRTPDTEHFREYMRRILQRLVDRGTLTPAALEAAHPLEVVWPRHHSDAGPFLRVPIRP